MIITEITKIGDPQIFLWDNTYYCYATHGEPGKKGFYVWKSTDLHNFDGPYLCLDASDSWGCSNFWAPEVVYRNGKFVMHFTAKDKKLNSLRIGVAVADSPMGPFVDVYGHPMFDFGYAAIDGSVLQCKDGNYLYYSRDCCENIVDGIKTSQIYCVRLSDDLLSTVGDGILMTTPENGFERKSLPIMHLWNEGPCVTEFSNKYVMNYSANYYASNDYSICLAVAEHPQGPWLKPKSNPVLCSKGEIFGAGHNAFFTDKEGNLRTSFHIQTNPAAPSGDRRVVIGNVTFTDADGEIREEIE